MHQNGKQSGRCGILNLFGSKFSSKYKDTQFLMHSASLLQKIQISPLDVAVDVNREKRGLMQRIGSGLIERFQQQNGTKVAPNLCDLHHS